MRIEYVSYWLISGETLQNCPQEEGKAFGTTIPTALVWLRVDGSEVQGVACGANDLDALLKAFCRAAGIEINLEAYQLRERFQGGNPISEVSVRISLNTRISLNPKEGRGYGKAQDSQKAFLLALIEGVNQIQQKVKDEIF